MTPKEPSLTAADAQAASLQTRDARVSWHPYTQHGVEDTPLAVAAAKGSELTLADGRVVIDAISSWWAILHGHGEARIADAMAAQARELDHVLFAGATHEPAVRLAERLVEVTPRGLDRVFYSDNGSTAVEVALKMVLQRWQREGATGRDVFVALDGAYHGDTFGAMSIGDPDPFFLPFQRHCFLARRVAADLNAMRTLLDELGDSAAGVIVEPLVQGAAGMQMHSIEFLRGVRALTRERGLPLIADEVMTGFGRTGALFACTKANIEPDLLCLAKGLTGGLTPMSVTMASEAMFNTFVSDERKHAFFHGHTFTAHPIGCAAALASLNLVLERDVPAKLDAIGARIETTLRIRLQAHLDQGRITNLRRTGGIVAFDIATDGLRGAAVPAPQRVTSATSKPAAEPSTNLPDSAINASKVSNPKPSGYLSGIAPELRRRAIREGVLLRQLGNVLYAMPPASTTNAQADRIADAMAMILDG